MLQAYSALKSYTHLKVAAWGDLKMSLHWFYFSSFLCVPHLALYTQRIQLHGLCNYLLDCILY